MPAEHGDIDVAATDQSKRHRAIEGAGARKRTYRPSARIRQEGVGHALLRNRASADQSIFGLEEHLEVGRNVISDQGGNANSEIHEIAGAKFAGDAAGDDRLCIHDVTRSGSQ
jgi:hypothetical protein